MLMSPLGHSVEQVSGGRAVVGSTGFRLQPPFRGKRRGRRFSRGRSSFSLEERMAEAEAPVAAQEEVG
jgi:hypothetical protein